MMRLFHIFILLHFTLQMGSVRGLVLRGPAGGGVQPAGPVPGPHGPESQSRPHRALLHGRLWRHLPHDVSVTLVY